MIIYEVNLSIDKPIFKVYYAWLIDHINHMLTFPGFLQAELAKERTDVDGEQLTVRYLIRDYEALEDYFTNHAQAMRAAGLQKFGNSFRATRRIFEDVQKINRNLE